MSLTFLNSTVLLFQHRRQPFCGLSYQIWLVREPENQYVIKHLLSHVVTVYCKARQAFLVDRKSSCVKHV